MKPTIHTVNEIDLILNDRTECTTLDRAGRIAEGLYLKTLGKWFEVSNGLGPNSCLEKNQKGERSKDNKWEVKSSMNFDGNGLEFHLAELFAGLNAIEVGQFCNAWMFEITLAQDRNRAEKHFGEGLGSGLINVERFLSLIHYRFYLYYEG